MSSITFVTNLHFVLLVLLATYMALQSPSSWRQWRAVLLDEEETPHQESSWFSGWPWQSEECHNVCKFMNKDVVLTSLLLTNAGLCLMLWVAVAKRVRCLLIMWLLSAGLEILMALAAVPTLLVLDLYNCIGVCNVTGAMVVSAVAVGVLVISWLLALAHELGARDLAEPDNEGLLAEADSTETAEDPDGGQSIAKLAGGFHRCKKELRVNLRRVRVQQ